MSDLQDAADRLANRIPLEPGDREVLVEAARKYANPDIEAAAMERHRNGRPKCYEGPNDIGCYCWITTKKAVKVALSITEDDG